MWKSFVLSTLVSIPAAFAQTKVPVSLQGTLSVSAGPNTSVTTDGNGNLVITATAGAQLSGNPAGTVSAATSQLLQQLGASVPPIPNLFNYATGIGSVSLNTDCQIVPLNGWAVSDYIYLGNATTLVSNQNLLGSSLYAHCFFGANKVPIGTITTTVPAGTPIPVPAGAVYFRLIANFDQNNYNAIGLFAGTVVPSGTVPYTFPVPTLAVTPASISAANGRTFGVLGDSISAIFGNAWQNVVSGRTGAVLGFQDAHAGRTLAQAFDFYGGPQPGSAPGTFTGNNGYTSCSACVGSTGGQTLAQNLAAVDVLFLRLGTNDSYTPLGALGDATNAGTRYGNMRWVVETILAAKPNIRLLIVGPEFDLYGSLPETRATDAMEADVAAAYATPYLSLLKLSGNNVVTNSTYTRDGTHPSDWAFQHVDGPLLAQFLTRNY